VLGSTISCEISSEKRARKGHREETKKRFWFGLVPGDGHMREDIGSGITNGNE